MIDFAPKGLGYEGVVTSVGAGLLIDRLVESRGELTGELTVMRSVDGQGDHLFRGRFNISSLTARATAAKHLQGRSKLNGTGPDWITILEEFCLLVLDAERAGAPVVMIGGDRPRVPVTYLLRPFIFGGRKATVLYGYGGFGKSTIAGAAAVALQSGVTTFGGWHVERQTNVLVLDWEAEDDDWNETVNAVSKGIGIPPPAIAYQACDRPLPSMLHEIARRVTDLDIGLVIVDSAGHAVPSQREGASYEEGAMRLFKALRTLGVPSLLIDHTGKDDEGKQGPYGSAYKWHSMRQGWQLIASEQADPDGTIHLALIHRKSNNAALGRAPVGIALVRTDDELLLVPEDVADDERIVANMTLAQRLERVIRRNGFKPMTIGELAAATGAGPKTVAVTLNRRGFTKVGQQGREQLWALEANSNMLSNDTQHVVRGTPTPDPPLKGGGDRAGVPAPIDSGGPFDALIEANQRRST